MRIVCTSDLHGYLPKALNFESVDLYATPHNLYRTYSSPELPGGDVLVIAGDFSANGKLYEAVELNRWLGTVEIQHKILIAGNHDACCAREDLREIFTNAVYLQDSGIEIDGIKFYGSPWSPRFLDWFFMMDRGSDKLKRQRDCIPLGTDVVITHSPPTGKMDYSRGEYIGCELLRDRILTVKPKLHIFGHCHEGYGTAYNEHTIFVNASLCNDGYKPVNTPIVIDI